MAIEVMVLIRWSWKERVALYCGASSHIALGPFVARYPSIAVT